MGASVACDLRTGRGTVPATGRYTLRGCLCCTGCHGGIGYKPRELFARQRTCGCHASKKELSSSDQRFKQTHCLESPLSASIRFVILRCRATTRFRPFTQDGNRLMPRVFRQLRFCRRCGPRQSILHNSHHSCCRPVHGYARAILPRTAV